MRKHQQHILYIIVILLNLVSVINTNNTSALSYQSSVGVGFIFNPTLSVSLSSSDLVISNLVPGSTLDSNVINVSVASNASYGYTLSAIVNGNNSNLTHTNGTNTFSSIATNADLSDLKNSEDTNIWGYSYKDNTIQTPAWSNYNGLSSSNSATLLDTNTNNIETGIDSIDFKIAAKAASTQASGTYTGVINFTAVTKHIPVTLAEAYASEGKTMVNGFYTMQDMTSTICSKVEAIGAQLQVLDKRDNKIYWISKLADQKCWMTQNLELDLIANSTTLNSTNTDIDVSSYSPTAGAYSPESGYSKDKDANIATWSPIRSTATSLGNGNFPNTAEANNVPYSYDPGDSYYYPNYNSSVNSGSDFSYTLSQCEARNHIDCKHYKAGNYYNWSAAVASNNTSSYFNNSANATNSICPKNWRLPKNSSNEFKNLVSAYYITSSNALTLRNFPLYFVRSGRINNGFLINSGDYGLYWSSTSLNSSRSSSLLFYNGTSIPTDSNSKYYGFPIRCLAQ